MNIPVTQKGDRMQISDKIFEQITYVEKRYAKFKQIFAIFVESAQDLVGENSPLKALKLEASAEGNCLDVFFAGIHMRFLLLPCYGEGESARGRVVCSRNIPTLYKDSDILGSFTFSTDGSTDFDTAPGRDLIEMEYDATKIVLHFVHMAINKPLPGLVA